LEATEQGLIKRITAVVKDRRRTAAAFHRALESRFEGMDAKLRRSRRMTTTCAATTADASAARVPPRGRA
jgi:hypothetical protein